mgnify:CR=1 FL=1
METMAEYLAELVKAGLEDRKAASLPEGVSVRKIVKISEENHMDYLLLGALLKTDGLSEEEKELLREKVLGSMLFTGMQLQELKKLEERMEQAKIPCQPMKGARMKFYYPSPFLREMSDIDILIHGDFMRQWNWKPWGMSCNRRSSIMISIGKHRESWWRRTEPCMTGQWTRGSMPISRICPGRCAERAFFMCMILRRKISIFT